MALFYLALFLIFSFVGWILDTSYRSLLRHRFIPSGYFPFPLCPLYGFGGFVLLITFKTMIGYPLLLQIMVGGIAAILTEFFGGLFCVYVLKVRLWDYSQIPYNLLGQINLFHSIGWVVVTVVFYYLAFPQITLAEKHFHVTTVMTFSDRVTLGMAAIIGVMFTWLRYCTGPKDYCLLPGYHKKKS